ncbi:hypothetical protein Dip518_001518 [Parelusimicrobium proximum]|uniref:hypothetical protein n=1 Tax=Parelusimicrobium proximum TaxID=3228953 RepID=UPI003D1731BA
MTTAGETAEIKAEKQIADIIAGALPSLKDADKAALIKISEGKITIAGFEEDIKQIKTLIDYKGPEADKFVRDILLERTTTSAAKKKLRIIKNKNYLNKFKDALNFDKETCDMLEGCFCSSASGLWLDEELRAALASKNIKDAPENKRPEMAFKQLKSKAASLRRAGQYIKNEKSVLKIAEHYDLPFSVIKDLLNIYKNPFADDFDKVFENNLKQLEQVSPRGRYNASLAARALSGEIDIKDAAQMAELDKSLMCDLTEEDLIIVACRYLRTKSIQEVADTFEAVLKRLPFSEFKEENIGLAVSVLVEGTRESLTAAQLEAQKKKELTAFRKELSKNDYFDGFYLDLAAMYCGKVSIETLISDFENYSSQLPFCSTEKENRDLVCKILLGKISLEAAVEQAKYRSNLKAKSLTSGLAPGVIKTYLGTKSAEELTEFFEKNLQPYSFWKQDEARHLFALQIMVNELNGSSSKELTSVFMKVMEKDGNLEKIVRSYNIMKDKSFHDMTEEDLAEYYQSSFGHL